MSHTCSVNEECMDTLGNFTCRCKSGFSRNNDGGSCEGEFYSIGQCSVQL